MARRRRRRAASAESAPLEAVKHLVQLLLPLNDNRGTPIPKARFDEVKVQLVERFGGLTAYSQAPASGLWKDGDEAGTEPVHDQIVVFEVMVDALDAAWWSQYRRELAARFGQEELVVRAHPIELL